jgi:pimeloyl-ACP methyl ester carboxylesterase
MALAGAAVGATGQIQDGRFLDSDGVRIRYIDRGAGDAVLLIHGFTLDLEIGWVQPGVVDALVGAGYRVVAYDSRGHGQSDKPHDPAEYGSREVDDAARLLDHLGIEQAHIVGWSRGAFMANRLRTARPDRVRSVVLSGFGESGSTGGAIAEPARTQTADLLDAGDFRALVQNVLPTGSPEEIDAWTELLAGRNDHLALAATVRSGGSWPLMTVDELRANETPALAIIGDRDFLLGEVTQMQDVMGNLEVVVLPGADHGSTLSRPEFTTVLLGFLGKHSN